MITRGTIHVSVKILFVKLSRTALARLASRFYQLRFRCALGFAVFRRALHYSIKHCLAGFLFEKIARVESKKAHNSICLLKIFRVSRVLNFPYESFFIRV